MSVKNATDFVKLVETKLGYEVTLHNGAAWTRYQRAAAQVKKKVAENPELYTWHNLELAVEMLRREKKSRTPVGVFAHVQRALDLAIDDEVDVEVQIREAIAYEQALGDPSGWAVRLVRAEGAYRAEVLAEWRAAVK